MPDFLAVANYEQNAFSIWKHLSVGGIVSELSRRPAQNGDAPKAGQRRLSGFSAGEQSIGVGKPRQLIDLGNRRSWEVMYFCRIDDAKVDSAVVGVSEVPAIG